MYIAEIRDEDVEGVVHGVARIFSDHWKDFVRQFELQVRDAHSFVRQADLDYLLSIRASVIAGTVDYEDADAHGLMVARATSYVESDGDDLPAGIATYDDGSWNQFW